MWMTRQKPCHPTARISSARCWHSLTACKMLKNSGHSRLWRAHALTGDRKGTWSLSVTRNRRLTFWVDTVEDEICDVNLEDYH